MNQKERRCSKRAIKSGAFFSSSSFENGELVLVSALKKMREENTVYLMNPPPHIRLYSTERITEVKPVSVKREITVIASALHSAHVDFPELEPKPPNQ